MERYKLTIMFDGTGFHGWQMQDNAVTVQGELSKALSRLFNEDIQPVGCSRTDAGVHAVNFVCHFDAKPVIPPENLPRALGSHLPDKIAAKYAEIVSGDFHARFGCIKKTYRYFLYNGRNRNPFYENRAFFYPIKVDFDKIVSESRAFLGRHDFRAFMATGSEVCDTVREIYSFDVEKKDDFIIFTVCGNGFLYNMVRIMVGTLIDEGNGKLNMPVKDIIKGLDRKKSGFTVPPHGLYLWDAAYC